MKFIWCQRLWCMHTVCCSFLRTSLIASLLNIVMKPHTIIVISTACAVIAVLLPSANGAHGVCRSCAIATNGGVYCWGIGGSLGDGTTTSSSTPVAVVGLSGVVSIAHGDWHTCAVLSSGNVRCWGANPTGGLGDGTTTARLTPVDVIDSGSFGGCWSHPDSKMLSTITQHAGQKGIRRSQNNFELNCFRF